MIGMHCDTRVFAKLVEQRLPKCHAHLTKVCNSRHASVNFTLLVHLDTTRHWHSLAWRVMPAPQLDIPLQPIATIWFMSLFVHVLPLNVLEHMWDVFFLEGPKIMFRCFPPSPCVQFGKCDHQPFLIFIQDCPVHHQSQRTLPSSNVDI